MDAEETKQCGEVWERGRFSRPRIVALAADLCELGLDVSVVWTRDGVTLSGLSPEQATQADILINGQLLARLGESLTQVSMEAVAPPSQRDVRSILELHDVLPAKPDYVLPAMLAALYVALQVFVLLSVGGESTLITIAVVGGNSLMVLGMSLAMATVNEPHHPAIPVVAMGMVLVGMLATLPGSILLLPLLRAQIRALEYADYQRANQSPDLKAPGAVTT